MAFYVKLFGNQEDCMEYLGSDGCLFPNVSYCQNENVVILKENYRGKYLTFVPLESGTFSFSLNDLQYSLDNGDTWQTLTAGQSTPVIPSYSKIMWKGENLTPTEANGIGTFSTTCKHDVYGNIMSLYYGDNFSEQTDLSDKVSAFRNLFMNDSMVVHAGDLIMPAITIGKNCYRTMFSPSSASYVPLLETAPDLPATTLGDYCYMAMFQNCQHLTTPPKLPAMTMAVECYRNMFSRCSSLKDMPELPATTLAVNCYQRMFQTCSSLTTTKNLILPAATLAENCYYGMFLSCSGLTTAPELPATTLASSCYESMFERCSSLIAAPELPATTLVNNCYNSMFYNCSSLNYVKCLATDISATGCLTSWLNNVSPTGTFIKDPNTTWPSGTAGIPAGWTVQDSAD